LRDRGLEDARSVDHFLIGEARDPVSQYLQGTVAPPVCSKRLRRVVEFSAIEFNDDAAVHHKIDPPHSADLHLGFNGETVRS
jgi:hypothetical protein